MTHSFQLQGQVYAAGQGESGQLGLGPRAAVAPVPVCVPFPYQEYNIVFIAAGIAHNSTFQHACNDHNILVISIVLKY